MHTMAAVLQPAGSAALAAAVLCMLACLPLASAGKFPTRAAPDQAALPKAVDTRVKVLWLPVRRKDCAFTCQAGGLEAVRGRGEEVVELCAFVPYPDADAWWEGAKRARPNKCQAVAGNNGSVVTLTAGYYCGCLPGDPRKPGEADLKWTTTTTDPCPGSYGAVPYVCRLKEQDVEYIGWINDWNKQCNYYYPATGPAAAPRANATYGRLCGAQTFAYMCEAQS